MRYSKRVVSVFILVVCAVFMLVSTSVSAFATGLEDDLGGKQQGGSNQTTESSGLFSDLENQDIGDSDDVGDILATQQGMTSDQLNKASDWMSPVTNIIGYVMGIIIILTIAFVGLITALDLLYISVPPVRNVLYKAGTDGTGAFTGGMPGGGYGMGMGMGRRGMGMGAMGAGGMAGGTAKPTQWVSDEAVACAALLGGSQQAVMGQGMGGYGGMGMGYGGMGMGAPMQQQQPMRMKSVLWVYFKKRAFFLVLLMICVMVLTSSAIMGTGINLAKWVLRIINLLNGKIS